MRLARAAVLLGLAACANVQAPPGGPEDKQAPQLLATRPDTMASLQGWTGPVVFVFDEELAEAGVEDAVSLSPVRGRVAVEKEGDQIVIRPRTGWERGQIYQAEVAAGIKDRFGNARTEPIRLVFSTGPAIPDTRASGAVVERITGNPGQQTRVDAVRLRDSLTYTTRTDSAGRFEFRQVPEGEYRVIAYRDANRNGRPDPFEARDTARLTFAPGQAPTASLATLLPDTTPPVVRSATLTEGWVEVRTDDYLDPEQPLSAAQVAVVGPDSVAVAIAEVRVGAPPAARDTAEVDSAAPAAQPGPERQPPRADSAAAEPRGPLPAQALFVRPASPLRPDTVYIVRVTAVRNINGLVGSGQARLRTREAAPAPAPAPRVEADSPATGSATPAPPGTVRPAPADPAPAPGRPRASLPARGALVPARE
ncbi:MAG TPA: Ig-like domain-containing protein [Longimicrobium sp.]|jgi:hypothetical protein|uniref:Ig-like domain-containing protein n=1 Tax=Longimicrobium sp. TaxID=2029185 RepID=UPI002ED9A661